MVADRGGNKGGFMRGIVFLAGSAVSFLTACAGALSRRTPSGELKKTDPAEEGKDRYVSPLISVAKELEPKNRPNSGSRQVVVGASYQCDGKVGDQQAKGRCEARAKELERRVRELLGDKAKGKKSPCSETPHEGVVSGARGEAARYEWSCKIGKATDYPRGFIWSIAINKLFGESASGSTFSGELARIEGALALSLPEDPDDNAFFLLFRTDRRGGIGYELRRQELDNELDRVRSGIRPFEFRLGEDSEIPECLQ